MNCKLNDLDDYCQITVNPGDHESLNLNDYLAIERVETGFLGDYLYESYRLVLIMETIPLLEDQIVKTIKYNLWKMIVEIESEGEITH